MMISGKQKDIIKPLFKSKEDCSKDCLFYVGTGICKRYHEVLTDEHRCRACKLQFPNESDCEDWYVSEKFMVEEEIYDLKAELENKERYKEFINKQLQKERTLKGE